MQTLEKLAEQFKKDPNENMPKDRVEGILTCANIWDAGLNPHQEPDNFYRLIALREMTYRSKTDLGLQTYGTAHNSWQNSMATVYLPLAKGFARREIRRGAFDFSQVFSDAILCLHIALRKFNPWIESNLFFPLYALNVMSMERRNRLKVEKGKRERFERYSASRFKETKRRLKPLHSDFSGVLEEWVRRVMDDGLLSEKEKYILSQRFPLNGGEPKKCVVIAKEIGLCPEHVSRIQKKAFQRLRQAAEEEMKFYLGSCG